MLPRSAWSRCRLELTNWLLDRLTSHRPKRDFSGMFAQFNPQDVTQNRILALSVGVHCVLFLWLLRSPDPRLIEPASVALGRNGHVIARIYFPTANPDDSSTNSPDFATEHYRHQRFGHDQLLWKKNTAAKSRVPDISITPPNAQDSANAATLAKRGHGDTAGPLYGSLPGGPVYGDEIRPALPVATSDPVIYPWERPDSEGKVVIEITIDERGEIVNKTVLQSMGADIDKKCLAALEHWRFQPATHNGTPIASKQDAIFPFKPRGVSQDWLGLNRSPRPAIMAL